MKRVAKSSISLALGSALATLSGGLALAQEEDMEDQAGEAADAAGDAAQEAGEAADDARDAAEDAADLPDPDVEPSPPPPPPPPTTTTVTTVEPVEEETGFWPASNLGIELSLGGGVEDFAGDSMNDVTDTAGMWDVRGVFGSRSVIALEGAYTGSARTIDSAFDRQGDATLIGTGLEADLRVNVLPAQKFNPYAFGGIGWKRYDVTGADFETSDAGISDTDDIVEVPFGAGMSYRAWGAVLDARFTYRYTTNEDLVLDVNDTPIDVDADAVSMDTWGVTGRVGWEF